MKPRRTSWYDLPPAMLAEQTAINLVRKLGHPVVIYSCDAEAVGIIYQRAHLLTKETGIAHSVEHMVPLKNSLVSGLHVSWNMWVLRQVDNNNRRRMFNVEWAL